MASFTAYKKHRSGIAFILTMLILAVIAAMAVALVSIASTSIQITDNRRKAGSALATAQSGIDYAKYLAAQITNDMRASPTAYPLSDSDANTVWSSLYTKLVSCNYGGVSILSNGSFTDSTGSGDQIITNPISISANTGFSLRFFRYSTLPNVIKIQSTGTDDSITRTIEMQMRIEKESTVLQYAIAGRGRIIVTGDSTINGPVFSTWTKIQWKPPVETTSETTINGSISTVLSKQELADRGWQLATTDALGLPLLDADGNILHSEDDTVQGYYEGINYSQSAAVMPGLSENDYDTSTYKTMCTTTIPVSTTTREYFPHLPGDYTQKKESTDYRFDRHVYSDQTFTNAKLPRGRNALFTNCTFNEVLFIESSSYSSSTSKCNNVRFDNCTFNGVIVTDIPKNSSIQWIQNCLYFTGEASFNNTSSIQEATILAPNFNVNLGNTAVVEEGESSTLTGAIVGGIVDIRGNAEIDGTIISTYDTSSHSNGYVSNIGFANDGGSEGGLPEDVGTIHITPDPTKLLPSGVTSPIVITPLQDTYTETTN